MLTASNFTLITLSTLISCARIARSVAILCRIEHACPHSDLAASCSGLEVFTVSFPSLLSIHNACSRGRYPTSERPRSLSRQNNLGRYLACSTLRQNVSGVLPGDVILKERGASTLWSMLAHCWNEWLAYKSDYISWSHLLVGPLFSQKKAQNI